MIRKYSIDMLRIISAIAVIVIHAVSSPIANGMGVIDINVIENLELIHVLMNWSVPVFFIITGYCLMNKTECTYQYCFLHVLKYIGILFTIGLFYSLLEEVFLAKTFNGDIFVKCVMDVIGGNLWDHMWFIYSIIGIYLVMPVIHCFFRQDKNSIIILTSLLFLFNILCPTVNKVISVGIDFPFCNYLFYVCFGGIIAKVKTKKEIVGICCVAGIISIVWIIVDINRSLFGYNHLAVCFMAIAVFVGFSHMEIKQNEMLKEISECSLGIYLIHPFFINIVIKVLKLDLLTHMPYIKVMLFVVFLFVVSFITTYVLRKIPYVKKLF